MGNPRGMRRDLDALEKRRMAAVRLFTTDLNNSETGRRLKVCDQTVSRWRAQYRTGGESELHKAGRITGSTTSCPTSARVICGNSAGARRTLRRLRRRPTLITAFCKQAS